MALDLAHTIDELRQALPRRSRLGDILNRPESVLRPETVRVLARILLDPGRKQRDPVTPLLRPEAFLACEIGFIECRRLRVEYVDSKGARTERTIEPHGLLMRFSTWSIVAVDPQRRAGRTFRIDRMRKVEVLPSPFVPVDPRTLFEEGGRGRSLENDSGRGPSGGTQTRK